MPTIPAANGDAVVIEICGRPNVSENGLDAVCDPLSTTWTVKLVVPGVVGVPLTTPAADNVRPAGNVPDRTDQIYGAVPPVAVNV